MFVLSNLPNDRMLLCVHLHCSQPSEVLIYYYDAHWSVTNIKSVTTYHQTGYIYEYLFKNVITLHCFSYLF